MCDTVQTAAVLIYLIERRRYMFSPAHLRSFVCLSVCNITQKRVHGFGWNVACQTDLGTWMNLLTFQPDPDHSPDAGTRLLSPIAYALQHRILLCRKNPYWAHIAVSMHGFESYGLQCGTLLCWENPTYWYWMPIQGVQAAARGFEASKHHCRR